MQTYLNKEFKFEQFDLKINRTDFFMFSPNDAFVLLAEK